MGLDDVTLDELVDDVQTDFQGLRALFHIAAALDKLTDDFELPDVYQNITVDFLEKLKSLRQPKKDDC